ncbi:hypothetical protein KIN20_013292 [Parelaphostrongylus tenuis]|uniref:Endonuclease/exonuclease/phosphatase domain-containing protein n=1 Tax=Parelaphostrongylus tenuis TaxID=148309 RepID=A0AAD5MGE8_PARTN|nr:hypothetical protein KIN20_013292 [Parelaphostrongylus tenuis]
MSSGTDEIAVPDKRIRLSSVSDEGLDGNVECPEEKIEEPGTDKCPDPAVQERPSSMTADEEHDDVECLEEKSEEHGTDNRLDSKKEEILTDFMSITNADRDAALSILESVYWDVNRGLDFFFGTDEKDREEISSGVSDVQNGPVDLTGLEVSLVSWNIDGLDGNNLSTRMKGVYKIINNLNPDFVFLQEVVGRELPTINRFSTFYNIFYSNEDYLYFTAILVSKMFEVDSHNVIHYQNSGMGRTLQIVEGKIGIQKVFLLNTHLESMREHSKIRKEQFKECMEKIREIISNHPNCLLFFGGDLNIRDDEVSNVPRGLEDAWISAGRDKQAEFTWDTRKNDNKRAFGARNRFDRIYWYGPLHSVKFSLAGQQRIRSCLCFPSDHWAVHCEFS